MIDGLTSAVASLGGSGITGSASTSLSEDVESRSESESPSGVEPTPGDRAPSSVESSSDVEPSSDSGSSYGVKSSPEVESSPYKEPSSTNSLTSADDAASSSPMHVSCTGTSDVSCVDADDVATPEPTSAHTSLVTDDDGGVCTPLPEGEVVTVYSIIYTETLTWTGDPADYTDPYPTMDLPTYCEPTTADSSSEPMTTATPKFTSLSGLGNGWNTYCLSQTSGETSSCTSEPVFNPSFIFSTKPIKLSSPLIGLPNTPEAAVTTFYITSKNPTVVFPPEKTPDYGADPDPDDIPVYPGGHEPAQTRPPSRPPQSAVQSDPPRVTITAEPTRVIIGTHTISDIKPGVTTRVTVGGDEYEINPSQIVQAGGQTVNRPGSGRGVTVAASMSTVVDGVGITVTGSHAVVGGYTYTIRDTPETEVVQGRTVVIAPTGIHFRKTDKSVTYQAVPPEDTGIIVAGGEMLTAIGGSVLVIHEKTITYGPGTTPHTETVDDDTIVVGPDGITVHGSTVGGDGQSGSETRYDVVGGATLTRLGASKIIIGDETFTVGPGTDTTTTFVGGEDVTIAPDGVTVDTLTIPFPFGPTVVTAIPAPRTSGAAPQETDGDDDDEDEEDAGGMVTLGWTEVCIAIGAWLLL